jgi:hypothetical protein
MTPSFDEIRFRASSSVELRRLEELDAAQRAPFLELQRDPSFHGLFIPRPPLTMSVKSVERQTAELFLSLATPARLDRALLDDAGYIGDVVDLVLDGFLEIESGGRFISGADAFPIVCSGLAPLEIRDVAARLSRDALLHAQDLETSDADELTMSLYRYHRIPMTPFWKARLANRDAVRAHLGANRGPLRLLLEREWTDLSPEKPSGWLTWSSKAQAPGEPDRVGAKLFVSPRPERIRDAFEIVVRVLSEFPGLAFKVGDDAMGLLRPDKLVVYFTTREQLGEVAGALRRELAGCEAHGVPFTAGLDENGLLSWGVDPPKDDQPLSWMTTDSWRLWIVGLLGPALAIAKLARGEAAVEPWRFAVERIRRAGVDPETWTPSPTLWSTP